MKKLLILIVILATSNATFGQDGINYKAKITDDLENPISNTSVQINFTVLEGVAQTNVYQETHNTTTDVNGLVIVNIGEGTTVSGVFDTISWGTEDHFLNVQIDSGSGLVDMGTTQFGSVPYAFNAETANNVTGLEALEEGNGTGWRLVSRNPNNYDNVGFNAIDFSFVDDPNLGLGATGDYAFSLGHNGTASGEHSLAFGDQNFSLNDFSIAMGNNNLVSGLNSTAIGGINQVQGNYAVALGLQNQASNDYSFAMGNNAIASGDYAVAFGNASEASGNYSFAFGNGASATAINAIALGENALASFQSAFAAGFNTEASATGSISMGLNTEASGLSSISIGTGLTSSDVGSISLGRNSSATGATSIAIGSSNLSSGTGSVAIGSSVQSFSNYSIGIGRSVVNAGESAVAMGRSVTVSGDFASAMGRDVDASGDYAVAMGRNVDAEESSSIAIGEDVSSLARNSMVLGVNSEALAIQSAAIGRGIIAQGVGQTVVGSYNEAVGTFPNPSGTPFANEPVFIVGSGGNDAFRENALTVLFNNSVGIGTNTPQERLHINGRVRIGTETIEDTGSNQLSFNASLLPDGDNVMRLGNSSNRWIGVWAVDGTINTSDRRDKENINDLKYGLTEIQKLKPVSFNWKKRPEAGVKLGLIAQDLQSVIPEVVKAEEIVYSEEDSNSYEKKSLDRIGVYYSDLIPVLIKAIQEQQEIIENQQSQLDQKDTDLVEIRTELNELRSLILNQLSTKNTYSQMKD